MKRIPFLPFPLKVAFKLSRPLLGLASSVERLFPALPLILRQAELDIDCRRYVGIAMLAAIFWFSISFLALLSMARMLAPELGVQLGLMLGSAMGFLSFFYIMMYPRLLVVRKIREIERTLLYAVRHLAVQIKSGVPLYDALVSLSEQEYGLLSEKVGECVKRISAGWSAVEALDELALENPSPYFRRTIWQITNAMRAGVELGDIIESILNGLIAEHRVAIRRYGSQLSPLVMIYMMLGILIPSMGIAFLFILSTFAPLPIDETILVLMLGLLAMFQFSFMGLIKGRRPPFEI
jgi:flagellar protein FlaJ